MCNKLHTLEMYKAICFDRCVQLRGRPTSPQGSGPFLAQSWLLQPVPHPGYHSCPWGLEHCSLIMGLPMSPEKLIRCFPGIIFFLIILFSHYIPGEIKRIYFTVSWPISFNNWKQLCTRNNIHNFKCAIGKPKQN